MVAVGVADGRLVVRLADGVVMDVSFAGSVAGVGSAVAPVPSPPSLMTRWRPVPALTSFPGRGNDRGHPK